jgi:hypothetical protein
MFAFSQSQIKFEAYAGPTKIAPKKIGDVLCSQSNVDPMYQWFLVISQSWQLIANDLYVEPNEIFTFEQIIVDLVSTNSPGIDNIDVIIWSDNGGLPDTVLESELALTPTIQTLVGSDPFGNDVYETIIDLPNPPELEGGLSGTTFWVQLFAHSNSGSTGWHSSMTSIEGYPLAVDVDGMGWEIGNTDGVYIFAGDCSPVLEVDENFSNQIVIYPNPTKDILTFQSDVATHIVEIELFSLLGKRVNIPVENNRMDISSLSTGIYLLHLTTEFGTSTKQVVKY